jgi:hypothetical protein
VGFVLEISIELNPQYDRKFVTSTKANWARLLNPNSPAIISSEGVNEEITLPGNLVINSKSSKYGELIWKKNIALNPSSFSYAGSLTWTGIPTMADELIKENLVYKG